MIVWFVSLRRVSQCINIGDKSNPDGLSLNVYLEFIPIDSLSHFHNMLTTGTAAIEKHDIEPPNKAFGGSMSCFSN